MPLYEFGYGLSYTHFEYTGGNLSTSKLHAGEPINVSVQVKNTGAFDGDETVELYFVPKAAAKDSLVPLKTLVGFKKVHLQKGETKLVQSTIDPRQLSLVAADGSRSIESGEYDLYVGGGQPSHNTGLFLSFRIEGSIPVAP